MKCFLTCLALGLVVGCGGSHESTGVAPSVSTPDYELHEWGVITTSSTGTLVTAGPPRSTPLLTVDKPVLYFHTSAPVSVQLEVLLSPGFEAREHYPPTHGLSWSATLVPEGCTAQHRYPTDCGAVDGVCEVTELARYETRDSACVQVGDQRVPLLFYRLGATRPVSLPAAVEVTGSEVRAHATRGEVRGWRVARVDGEVRAEPFTLGQTWQPLPTPTQPWTNAAESLNASLREAGLTGAERAAFQRAWWAELFGAPPPAAGASDAAIDAMDDGEFADEQARPSADRVAQDQDAPFDVLAADDRGAPPGASGAGVLDVIFYLLTPEEVERVAQIAATPAPRRVARAFLVRHVL